MEDKLANLIEKLHMKTNNNEINWSETGTGNVFEVSFTNYSIRIFKEYTFESEVSYTMRLTDSQGETIDEIDSNSSPIFETEMRDLFANARRKAMGADQAIDDILAEIDNDVEEDS